MNRTFTLEDILTALKYTGHDAGADEICSVILDVSTDKLYELMEEFKNKQKAEKIELVKKAVEQALCSYSADNVDINREEVDDMVDIIYHSRHNSFPIISNVCSADDLTEDDISKIADEYDIGYCW